jgi:membrane fusion protein, multidrug efflux system
MRYLVWAIAFPAALAAFSVSTPFSLAPALAQAPSGRPAGVVPVRIATAAQKSIPVQLDTIGTVQTIASVAIKSRIDAVIDQVQVQDGQFVKAGDVLFKLDSRAVQAQLDQVAANLARDQAQLANAQRDVERYRPLLSKDFVSHQQFDTSSTAAKSLEATVKADEAQLENAKVQLSYYTITAPIDGRVGMIAIKRGNSIKANDVPLATLNQMQPIYVSFALPQTNFPDMRVAMANGAVPVRVVPQGDKGAPVEGKVAFFDNTIDATSGTITVRASFTNEQQRLWPGQFVNVSVLVRMDPEALVVPQAAVQIGQNGNYVFVIKDDNTAETRPVTVDRIASGQSVISKGLKPGEKVVVDGQLRVTDGTHVQIVTDDAQKGDAS